MKRDNNRAKRRRTALAEKCTGTWFCSHGYHHVRGPKHRLRGRQICSGCLAKVRPAHHTRNGGTV